MVILANHKTIKKQNPDTYRQFFENNDLVVSTNANFFWGGEYGVMDGGPAIVNLFPRKIFLGFSKIKEKKVIFDSYFYYENEEKSFRECSGDLFSSIYGQEKFDEWYQYLLEQGFDSGLKINILTEVPLDTSAGVQGNVAYLFSLATFLFLEKINEKHVRGWKEEGLSLRLSDKKFMELLYFSWSFDAFLNGYFVSGVHSFTASLFEKEPIVFLKEGLIKPDFKNYLDNQKIKFSALQIKSPSKGLGFDVAVVFSGKTKKTGQNVLKTMGYLEEREVFIKEAQKFVFEDKFLLSKLKESNLKDSYFQASKALSWEIVSALSGFLAGKKDFEKYLFDSINNYQNIFSLLGILGEGEVLHYIYNSLRDLKINFKPIGSGGGGSLLLVDKYGELETKIVLLDKKLREKGLFLEVYFFSNTDGWEVDGPTVEQFLSAGSRADHIKGRIFKGLSYDCAQNKEEELIFTDFEQVIKKNDFVIDLDSNKLFIKGKKITSKDLHSAKITVEILEKLINNDFHMLSAEQISVPSYRDRYEIQSKVISPLIKLVKEKLGKKMPLEIKGELSRFNLKLGKANLKIVLGKEVL